VLMEQRLCCAANIAFNPHKSRRRARTTTTAAEREREQKAPHFVYNLDDKNQKRAANALWLLRGKNGQHSILGVG
jgi:hypothetical protein